MTGYPFLFYGLIGVCVFVLLAKKARSAAGLAKPLSYAAALTSGAVGATALIVFLTQWFELPGAGLLMIPSTLLSIAFWTASLIWAGPATCEDRQVFIGTCVLALLMFISAPVLG